MLTIFRMHLSVCIMCSRYASYDDDIYVKPLIIMILSNHTRVTNSTSINCFGQILSGSSIHLQHSLLLVHNNDMTEEVFISSNIWWYNADAFCKKAHTKRFEILKKSKVVSSTSSVNRYKLVKIQTNIIWNV